MKTKKLHLPLPLACTLCLAFALPAAMAGDTNTPAPAPPVSPDAAIAEEFGFDFYNGKSYRIGKVTEVKPTYVAVIYADVPGGRKIPRQSLPDKLAALYPYDVEKAAAFEKMQMEIAGRQALAQQQAIRELARKQEQDLANQITEANRQGAKLDADIRLHKKQPNSKSKRAIIENLVNQRQQVGDRLAKLQSQLDALKARQASMP